jgi:hypothetical protein
MFKGSYQKSLAYLDANFTEQGYKESMRVKNPQWARFPNQSAQNSFFTEQFEYEKQDRINCSFNYWNNYWTLADQNLKEELLKFDLLAEQQVQLELNNSELDYIKKEGIAFGRSSKAAFKKQQQEQAIAQQQQFDVEIDKQIAATRAKSIKNRSARTIASGFRLFSAKKKEDRRLKEVANQEKEQQFMGDEEVFEKSRISVEKAEQQRRQDVLKNIAQQVQFVELQKEEEKKQKAEEKKEQDRLVKQLKKEERKLLAQIKAQELY